MAWRLVARRWPWRTDLCRISPDWSLMRRTVPGCALEARAAAGSVEDRPGTSASGEKPEYDAALKHFQAKDFRISGVWGQR